MQWQYHNHTCVVELEIAIMTQTAHTACIASYSFRPVYLLLNGNSPLHNVMGYETKFFCFMSCVFKGLMFQIPGAFRLVRVSSVLKPGILLYDA